MLTSYVRFTSRTIALLCCLSMLSLTAMAKSKSADNEMAPGPQKDDSAQSGPAFKSGSAAPDAKAMQMQVRPEKQVIIERPIPSRPPLSVQIWTDKSAYAPGEVMRIYFRANRDCYIYIFNTDAQAIERQLFPNFFDRDNQIDGHTTFYIPDRSYILRIAGPSGRENLQAVAVAERRYEPCVMYDNFSQSDPYPRRASKQMLEGLSKAKPMSQPAPQPVPQPTQQRDRGPATFDRKNVIVEPAPVPVNYGYEYATAFAYFWVRGYQPYPMPIPDQFGQLRIHTTPSDANVYLDGQLYGKSPITINGIPYGIHDVYIERPGYLPARQRVSIDGVTPGHIHLTLEREGYGYVPSGGVGVSVGYNSPGGVGVSVGYQGSPKGETTVQFGVGIGGRGDSNERKAPGR